MKIAKKLILILSFFVASIMLVIMISRLFISVQFNIAEPVVTHARYYIFFNFYTCIAIVLLLFVLKKIFNLKIKISENIYLLIIFFIPILIGFISYLIFGYKSQTDSLACLKIAQYLNDGHTLSQAMLLDDKYLVMFPFQYGFISILRLLELIVGDYCIFAYQCIQILFSGIANVLLYKCITLKKNSDIKDKITFCLLSILWVIPYLYAPYVYGMSLGLSLSIISFYYFSKYNITHNKSQLIISIIILIVAIAIKMNYAILAIAYLLYFIFLYHDKIKAKIINISIAILAILVGLNINGFMANVIDGTNLGKGIPLMGWLVMSSPNKNEGNTRWFSYANPGYYNAYIYEVMLEANYDSQIASEIINKDLLETVDYIKNNPQKSLSYYWYKFASTWDSSDFLTSSFMTGEGDYDPDNSFVQSLDNGILRIVIDQVTNVGSVLILLGTVVYLYKYRKHIDYLSVIPIWFIGGFVYHMLFEAKATYVYPYITILLPLATLGIINVIDNWKIKDKINKNIVIVSIILFSSLIFIINKQKYPLYCYESYADIPQLLPVNSKQDYIEQDFVLDYDTEINSIEINYEGNLNENILKISILENGKYLKTIDVYQNDIHGKTWGKIDLESIKLKKNKLYTLQLFVEGNSESNFQLYVGPSEWANGKYVRLNSSTIDNSVINIKLYGLENSRWYYYQDNTIEYISDLYYEK